jgi:CRP-like cAMP-binding protein
MAETLIPCIVKCIPSVDFLRFMNKHTEVSQSTAQAIARDYDGAALNFRHSALSTDAAGKLASILLGKARMDHLDHNPAQADQLLSLPMQLTNEELGSMAGLSPKTVTRLLARFHQEGLIDQTPEYIMLPHPDQLEARYY